MKWDRLNSLSLSFCSVFFLLLPFSIVPALADDNQEAIVGLWQAIDSFARIKVIVTFGSMIRHSHFLAKIKSDSRKVWERLTTMYWPSN